MPRVWSAMPDCSVWVADSFFQTLFQFFHSSDVLLFYAICRSAIQNVSFVLPAKRKNAARFFSWSCPDSSACFSREGRKEARDSHSAFWAAFLPFQLMEFLGILMPLTGKVCQCFTESFRILQPGFLPLTIAEQQVGSRKGLGQQGGLLFSQ